MKRLVLIVAVGMLITCVVATTRLWAADMKAVAQNYSESCSGCHGASGRCDGKGAATLKTKPRDFTECSRRVIVKCCGSASHDQGGFPWLTNG